VSGTQNYRYAFVRVRSLHCASLNNITSSSWPAPALRNHPLKEQFAGYRSIDVTGDYRAIFREAQAGPTRVIIFSYFGTHKQLYG
jgi:mRNA-degrading endonuclease YafQ of YafQ-DinJ toxin-antitoxin module